MNISLTSIESFWKRVEKTGDCWLWKGFKNPFGYGCWSFYLPDSKTSRTMSAHRFSYLLTFGSLPPKGKFLCHTCDTPSCVNAEHLWIGTALENARDMVKKGRGNWQAITGENNHSAKLNNKKSNEIIRLYATGQFTQRSLAKKYNVAQSTVMRLLLGRTWKHCN